MAQWQQSRKPFSSCLVWAIVGIGILLAGIWLLFQDMFQSTLLANTAVVLFIMVAVPFGGFIGGMVWLTGRSQRNQENYFTPARTPNDLLLLTPMQFEYTVAELLRSWGYRDVQHIGGGGDLAVDVVCRTPDNLYKVVVQCKRYAPGNSVGSPEIQKFIGMMTVHHQAQIGIFVTTSMYTQPALALAQQHNLWTIDGNQLAAYFQQY